MSPRRPLAVVLAASALAASALLTGCGVAGTDFQPGVAASVEGETVPVAEVREVASAMCDVLRSDQRFEGQTYAGATIRNAAERGLVLRLMGEELLAAYDVSLPEDADDGEAAVRENYLTASDDDLETAMPAFTGDQYLFNVLVALGQEEAGADAGQEAVVAAGVERAKAWQEDADIETNPAFEAIEIGDDQLLTSRDDLSVATSDFATSVTGEEGPDGTAGDLPESQRCG